MQFSGVTPLYSPFQLSLDTLIAASPLLGHVLEDRGRIRHAQDASLVQEWQARSTVPLSNPDQQGLFCVAPLDILVSEADGEKQFHIIEQNGTGIGGLTNISGEAVGAVLDGLAQMALSHWSPEALVLVASSGKESDESPRLNRLIYEKLLYADALKRGFELRGSGADVTVVPNILGDPRSFDTGRPTVVVGYIKEFLQHLVLEDDGRLSLFGRTVNGAVNDRFCLNVVNQFGRQVDLNRFITMNRCFLAGGDKGVCYSLLNEYLQAEPRRYFPRQVHFAHATCREELIATVLDWVRQGRKTVIKPHATGVGHGIEFFLSSDEREGEIIERIDGSIRLTEQFYRATGGAFPYTVCEFIDTCTVARPEQALFGHKYELRVVVYRDGLTLKAFPSIVKISAEAWDAGLLNYAGLINNITASSSRTKHAGTEFMLPLSNRETLALLDLDSEHLAALCAACTGYVGYVLDQVQQQPARFGLPALDAPVLLPLAA